MASFIVFMISKLLGYSLAITSKQFWNCLLAGFLFLAYGNGVFVWALKWVDSGFASLLAALQPLIILLMMRIIQRKKLQWKSMIGVAMGFTGMLLLVSQSEIIAKEGMHLMKV